MLKIVRNILLLCAVAAPSVLHAAGGAVDPGVNWLQNVTDEVSTLITDHGDALVDMGRVELSFIALYTLIAIVCRWQLAHMVVGNRPVNFTIGDFFVFLLQLSACLLMLNYYNTPLPGTAVKFHQIFSYIGQLIANIFDSTVLNDFTDHINAAIAKTEKPAGALNIFSIVFYDIVIALIAVARAIMFAIDSASFIFSGIFVLFGPLLIPLYMTRHFAGKFWGWLDGLLVVSMWRPVAAGMSFIWWNVYIGFFDKTLKGDYTLGHWLEVFPILILLVVASGWCMLKVPMIASWIFGGLSGGGSSESLAGIAISAVKKAF